MAQFDYEAMVQKALRKVVRDTLADVQKNGLSGSHHFYITFQTDRSDVQIPDFLRERHPEEITIVLQHQFWDLKVTDTHLSVTLSFNDKQEVLVVPFTALISFLDPSVKFGLQFMPDEVSQQIQRSSSDEGTSEGASAKKAGKPGDNIVTLDKFRKKP
jgi:hypothetical protein